MILEMALIAQLALCSPPPATYRAEDYEYEYYKLLREHEDLQRNYDDLEDAYEDATSDPLYPEE
ncbi:hypothetical protein SAMN02745671_00870 [Anaerovibrio lipolyticus DSM 3074]|uniref:Uncharacterized protein n=1 Tax=Anaerovibrio lipolyticus DSM 3074 TaxID=1120997 RepID=A0A1M6BW49_9FIRM|nr:hypothetical protein [Anaerovibrio lipolyticus]SHI52901.1 hypothetical protein SAMN02745671_00870 [Anaerovibrio lipolyticus DSM 3074]